MMDSALYNTAAAIMHPAPKQGEPRAPRSEVRRMARLWLRLRQAARERATYEGKRRDKA
jgi:hypothetical protein